MFSLSMHRFSNDDNDKLRLQSKYESIRLRVHPLFCYLTQTILERKASDPDPLRKTDRYCYLGKDRPGPLFQPGPGPGSAKSAGTGTITGTGTVTGAGIVTGTGISTGTRTGKFSKFPEIS